MFLTFYGTSRAHGHDAHGHGHDAHGHDDHGAHEPHESPMTMLIPLGALALGAVFSGMLWYNSFFGDEAKMRAWFGMEAAAHGEAAAEGDHAAAPAEGEAAAAETHDAAPADAGRHAAVAPKGAIFLGPDNHVIHAAHEAPTWVKVSPFVAMLIGPSWWPGCSTSRTPACRAAWPRSSARCTCSC
jgi:NADH-quinone oxidoreductase subunit L